VREKPKDHRRVDAFTRHVAVAVFVGSLSDIAVSVTFAEAEPSGRLVAWTGIVADVPNFAAAKAFRNSTDQPWPLTETVRRKISLPK